MASAMIACQRWGLRTAYVGKIGDDFAGRFHRQEFEREGVETHLIEVANCESQISFILVEQSSGERTILWKRDPRLDMDPRELRPDWVVRARMLHVDGHPCAPATEAARWAREAGVPVLADLDNIYGDAEALLENVDYLISSKEFPGRLTGKDDLLQSLPEIARCFGCKVAGTTLGAEGALAWDGENFHYAPAFVVDAVDTTGAGDIFHAAFAYSLLKGGSLDRALEFSCAAAALNCIGAWRARWHPPGGRDRGTDPQGRALQERIHRRRYFGVFRTSKAQSSVPQAKHEGHMIPLRAENPHRSFAIVNALLIVANILAFVYQVTLPPRSGSALVSHFGVVPARAERALAHPGVNIPLAAVPLVTSMFLQRRHPALAWKYAFPVGVRGQRRRPVRP